MPGFTSHDRLPDCESRNGLLQVAEVILGDESHETNFLECSSWPVTALDIHLSLYSPNDMRETGDGDCFVLYRQPAVTAALMIDRAGTGLENAVLARQTRLAGGVTAQQRPYQSQLRLAALGLHVASTLEPVSALKAAAGDLRVSTTFFGHPCYGSPSDMTLRHACRSPSC